MHRIKSILLLLAIFLPLFATSQVFNTERKRNEKHKNGWTGSVDFGLSLIQNTRNIFQLTNHVDVQWVRDKHRLMLLNDIRLMQVDQSDLLNRGFQHVRYNYEMRPYLIPEAFVQIQYNQIWNINMRFLAGTGPRFRLHKTDSSRLYVGTLVMYEYEEISDTSLVNRDFRFSAYLSAGYAFNPWVSVDHITYFQPRIDRLSDFRISTDTSLRFALASWVAFKTTFSLSYDTAPPEGLQQTFYSLINAVSFNF